MFSIAVTCLAVVSRLVSGDLQQQQALSSAVSAFSQKFYQQTFSTTKSSVFSPYSVHSALSMTSLGARGDTATEISQALGVTSLGASTHLAYKELIQQLNTATDVELNTVNAIYVNPNYNILPQFVNDVTNYYSAVASNFDLSAPGGPEQPINDFIAAKTKNTIKNTVPTGTIDRNTVLLLVNTIFFNGTWERKFPAYESFSQDFHKADGAVELLLMMHDDRTINVKRDNVNGVDVAELPFKGGRFSLYIALPQKVDGISELEKLLATAGKVDDLFAGLSPVRLSLAIPVVRLSSSMMVSSNLKDMGIVKAFSPMAADFTGITQSAQVYLSHVIHNAVIDIKETGTVAAAATVIDIVATSVQLPPAESFVADHPFLYFLRDKQTGLILFQGQYSG
ncbi:unnamed protein product [Lymnaea stagnalis]|uniref:Serpin domain-containing protein n=1 Tax=Lymnaea stagnalis TaxID=6523 RepID=A0AAV2IFC7_LYMST